MDLNELKKEMSYKWRVQSTNQWGCQCVAYIDSRMVQDRLDEVCGPGGWQNKYEIINGSMFCSIGIKIGDEWIWKTDCGTESQIEKQKGLSSDAFKRAAVLWGIGRFLYALKIRKIKDVIESNGRYFPAYQGKRIYDVNQFLNNNFKEPPAPTKKLSVRDAKVKKWIDDKAACIKTKEGWLMLFAELTSELWHNQQDKNYLNSLESRWDAKNKS